MINLLSKITNHNSDLSFWKAFIHSLSIVFISGFGDKTFILNMIYVSTTFFWKAFLIGFLVSQLMNMSSLFLGHILPSIINRSTLDWCAIVIFLIFGTGLLYQGFKEASTKLSRVTEVDNKELLIPLTSEEETETTINNVNNDKDKNFFDSWWKYVMAYIVGELGDKSQISTIIITSKYNFNGVCLGTAMAQFFILVSSMLLGKYISGYLKGYQVNLLGAFVFLMFALIYLADKIFGMN